MILPEEMPEELKTAINEQTIKYGKLNLLGGLPPLDIIYKVFKDHLDKQQGIDWQPIDELTDDILLNNEYILFKRKRDYNDIILASASMDQMMGFIRISSCELDDDICTEDTNKLFSYFAIVTPPKQ